MLYFKFVDEDKNPVEYLIADGSVSDSDGLLSVYSSSIINTNNKPAVYIYNMFSKEEQLCALNSLSRNPEKPTTVIWNSDTPREVIAKEKNKVLFRVIDEDGKPIQGVEFSEFISKDAKNSQVKSLAVDYPVLPTDQNGETFYTGLPLKNNNVTIKYKDASKLYSINISEKNLKYNSVYTFTTTFMGKR